MSVELEIRLRDSALDLARFVDCVSAAWSSIEQPPLQVRSRHSLEGLTFESADGSSIVIDSHLSPVVHGDESGRWAILAVAVRGDTSLRLLAVAAGILGGLLDELILDEAGIFSSERWIRADALTNWAAQSDVAPDGSSSLAPPGAPSSAPRVNAGIGPAPESDDGDDKNGQ